MRLTRSAARVNLSRSAARINFTRSAARWVPFAATGLSLVLAATLRAPADTPTESQTKLSHVESQNHLLNDIKYLASDELEGRGIGTKGLNKAADYIREQFKDAGLDVKIRPGTASSSVLQRVANYGCAFGVENADRILLAKAQEAHTIALMAPIQKSPRAIMVHAE